MKHQLYSVITLFLLLLFLFIAGHGIGRPALSARPDFTSDASPDTVIVKSPGCTPLPVPTITGLTTPCQGSSNITYTTEPGNFNYIWDISGNGTITGGSTTSSITVSWGTAGPGFVSVNYTNSSGCTAVSPTVYNVDVQPIPSASITITASTNPVCSGTAVTFTATPVNGGLTPGYDWKVNGIIASSGSPTYTFTPINGNEVVCQLTSSMTCASTTPVNSNLITMSVLPVSQLSVSVSASANPVCAGQPVTYTATANAPGSAPTYVWRVNGVVSGTNSPAFTQVPANNDQVNCQLTSSLTCVTGNPASSNTISQMVSSVLPISVSITASANPVCSGISVNYTATAVNCGPSPVYHWKVNGVNGGASQPTFAYTPNDGDLITCEVTSSASCTAGNVAVSNTIIMSVNVSGAVSISISPSENPTCQGTSVTLTATPVNGGTNPTYLWTRNGFSTGTNSPVFTLIPTNGDEIRCMLTSSSGCATNNPAVSNEIQMEVYSVVPATLIITASSNPVCEGIPVTYTAAATNTGTNPEYLWKANNTVIGSNQPVISYTPQNGDIITCLLTSSLPCVTNSPLLSNPITMTVSTELPGNISISADVNPICEGFPITFTASITNGGYAPILEWFVNGMLQGGSTVMFTYVPNNNDIVNCRLTANNNCSSVTNVLSNSITVQTNSTLPVSVSISPVQNPICEGQLVTINASAQNGGINPVFTWFVNGMTIGTSGSSLNYLASNNDQVQCMVSSDLTCATGNPASSNIVTLATTPVINSSITINCSALMVCEGQPVNFTSNIVNGGTNPQYDWVVNGISQNAHLPTFSYVPAHGDIVACYLTTNVACAAVNPVLSNSVSLAVSPVVTPSVTISASANPFCLGSPITFSAVPLNGGNTPSYQWYVNGATVGTNSPLYTYSPAHGDVITCRMTSSKLCVSVNPVYSNQVTMSSIQSGPFSITITPNALSVCAGTTVSFTSSINTNGGTNPEYLWYVNNVPKSVNATFALVPVNGDVVRCRLGVMTSCGTVTYVYSNDVTLSVTQPVAVTNTITASSNPFCSGSLVSFTAVPQNGGSAPVFYWTVNNNHVGGTGSSYTYTPVNGDKVLCKVISNATCITNVQGTSNEILMTVDTSAAVHISIQPSLNPVCTGAPVTFTASVIHGGSAPVFTWKVNNVIVGTNQSTYTYTPNNGDVVTCRLQSDIGCSFNNPATSNVVTMVVNSTLSPVSCTVTPSSNPYCIGFPVSFTAVPQNGGTAPVFQWYVNGIPAGTNSSTYIYTPDPNDQVYCVVTSNALCITGNPATSNTLVMIPGTTILPGITISASQTSVCENTSVSFTSSVSNAGINPVYEWKVNGSTAGTNSPVFDYIPQNTDAVTCILTSDNECVTNPVAVSNAVNMSVSPYLNLTASVAASANPACQGSPVTFTATPVNAGPSPVFQWKVNGISTGTNSPAHTYTPVAGDQVNCQVQSNAACLNNTSTVSNTVTMMIQVKTTVSVQISTPSLSVCQGSPVVFTAAPQNPGTTPSYTWKINGTPDQVTATPTCTLIPQDLDAITCDLYSSAVCPSITPAGSNSLVMNVENFLPVSATIATTNNPTCKGFKATYTASVVNGGNAPTYRWMVNGVTRGTNSATLEWYPNNGDVISCEVTSDLPCATENPVLSNSITMEVRNLLPVSISISPDVNPSCNGQSVTFTANAQNPGVNPVYEWRVSSIIMGTNSPSFSFLPVNGNVVTCKLVSSELCTTGNIVTSSPVTMTVNPNLPVSVAITAAANPVCAGNPASFTATATNGGSNPLYEWSVNNVVQATGAASFSYLPGINDVIRCSMISNLSCTSGNPAVSNAINILISNPQPVSLTIIASANPVCLGSSVTFTATPVNGGTSPTYTWNVNGLDVMTGSASYTYIPNDGDIVSCRLNSSQLCTTNNPAVSNTITMIARPTLPVSIAVTPSQNPACQGAEVTFTAMASNTGSSPQYRWTVNNIYVGNNSTTYSYVPTQDDEISCQITSSNSCATGNPAISPPVIMTINGNVVPHVFITSSANPVCEGTPVTFLANPTYPGPSPSYTWMVNSVPTGSNGPTLVYPPQDNDVVTCTMTSSESCAAPAVVASNSLIMTVSPGKPVSIQVTPSANSVCDGSPVSFTTSYINGGTSPQFSWEVNGIATGVTTPGYTYTPVNGDLVACRITSNLQCASGNPAYSAPVEMIVNSTLPVQIAIAPSSNPSCLGNPVTFTALPFNEGTAPTYTWMLNGFPIGQNLPELILTPSNGDQVSCIVLSSNSCASGNPATSQPVSMSVVSMMTPEINITSSSNPVCPGSSVTYTADIVNGGSSPMLQWFVNGLSAGSNSLTYSYVPAQGDQISCRLTSNEACATGNPANSNTITMVVSGNLPVSIGITPSATSLCEGNTVSLSSVTSNGGPFPQYQWRVNGVSAGTNSPDFTFIPNNGDQVSCTFSSSLSCATGNPATSNSVTFSVSPVVPVSVIITASANAVCDGIPITYTASETNAGPAPVYQWKINGTAAGGNSPVLIVAPGNHDLISCTVTSLANCRTNNPAASNVLEAAVFPLPTVHFRECFDPVTTTGARPFLLRGGLPLGGTYSGDGVDPATGIFSPSLAGPGVKVITYTYRNAGLCEASGTRTINVVDQTGFVCGNPLNDNRDAANPETYPTVQIGTQCWMAANLNYGNYIASGTPQTDNCIPEKYCFQNNLSNCSSKGGLYQWDELMKFQGAADLQGICPPGWHLPTEAEWDQLFAQYGGQGQAAEYLKSTGNSGFAAIPAGVFYSQTSWSHTGLAGFFWTALPSGPSTALSHGMNTFDNSVSDYPSSRSNAFSVRCVKD